MSPHKPERLTPDQKEVWDVAQPHVPKPSGGQTSQQAVNLGVLSFLFWCDFAGVGPSDPSETAIRAEFESAGVPELFPSEDFWERLRTNPGYPWVLAPGGSPAALDQDDFGRPAIYRMELRDEGDEKWLA